MMTNNFSNFLKTAVKDYWRVAALYPTPKLIVRKALKKINPEAKYFIEYGAGNGAFTREILKIMPADGKLLAIEINQEFVEQLKNIKDERLTLFCGNASDIPKNLIEINFPQIDIIISGIPFSRINAQDRDKIIKNSWELLVNGGTFITYQSVPIIVRVLKRYFKKINWYLEPRNFLPLFIIFAKK